MPIGRREVLLWCALAIGLLAVDVHRAGGPAFTNDSYQYLSEADNLGAGRGPSTAIVNFDVERAAHAIPAPLTTFPPGYAAAIAAIDRTGLDPGRSGLALSLVAFVALFPLLAWGTRILELPAFSARVVLFWLLTNASAAIYPLQILSDSTFTALATAALLAFMAGVRREAGPPRFRWELLLGHALVGLAYWVRYAGLLLFAAAIASHGLVIAIRRDRRAVVAALGCCVSGAMIGAGAVRNVLLTSSWKGGNTKEVAHPIGLVLKEFGRSIHHVVLGERAPSRVGAVEVGLALAAVVLALLAVRALHGRALGEHRRAYAPALLVLAAYAAVYCAGMIHLGVTSVISFGPRMFYPMLPVLLLGLGYLLGLVERELPSPSRARTALFAAAVALTACYAIINARSTVIAPARAPHEAVEARFAAPDEDGRPLRAWVDESIPEGAVLVAADAQATAYALRRKAVALLEAEYSDERWGPAEVEAVMASYGSEFLILYPTADPARTPVQRESPFLTGLLRGELPPWLTLAARSRDVQIFRRVPALRAAH